MKNISILLLLLLSSFAVFAQREYPPCEAYEDHSGDSIVAVNSWGNYLYAGIDNIVEFKPGVIQNEIMLETDNGSIYDLDGEWYIMPSKTGILVVTVYNIINQEKILYFKYVFHVKRLPKPTVSLCDVILKDEIQLQKGFMLSCDKMDVFYTDDLKNAANWLRVVKLSMAYSYGSYYLEAQNNTEVINDKLKRLIQRVAPGQTLDINITCINETKMKVIIPTFSIYLY